MKFMRSLKEADNYPRIVNELAVTIGLLFEDETAYEVPTPHALAKKIQVEFPCDGVETITGTLDVKAELIPLLETVSDLVLNAMSETQFKFKKEGRVKLAKEFALLAVMKVIQLQQGDLVAPLET